MASKDDGWGSPPKAPRTFGHSSWGKESAAQPQQARRFGRDGWDLESSQPPHPTATAWQRSGRTYDTDGWLKEQNRAGAAGAAGAPARKAEAPERPAAPPKPIGKGHDLRRLSANDLVGEPNADDVVREVKQRIQRDKQQQQQQQLSPLPPLPPLPPGHAFPGSQPGAQGFHGAVAPFEAEDDETEDVCPLLPSHPHFPSGAFPGASHLQRRVQLHADAMVFLPAKAMQAAVRSYDSHKGEKPRYVEFRIPCRRLPHLSFRLDVGEPSFGQVSESALLRLVVELERGARGSGQWLEVPRNYAISLSDPQAYFELPFSGNGRLSLDCSQALTAQIGGSASALVIESDGQ